MLTISFKQMSDTDFEEFCFDLLHELKFVNIDWRKGTPLESSPADKDRDIVAQQLREDVDKSKYLETWFVDSKLSRMACRPPSSETSCVNTTSRRDPIRSIQAILKAEAEFFDRVWYDRHKLSLQMEREGRSKTPRDIMKGARVAAKRAEAKYGRKNLGPYSDFDGGMINGRLSALRWILGYDWDMLDT